MQLSPHWKKKKSLGALAKVFVAHVSVARGLDPSAAETDALDGIEERLQALCQAGRAAWPGADIPAEDFVRYLAERLPAAGGIAGALDVMHATDLYLTCGCTLGNAAAIAAFDRHFIAQVSNYLRHRDALPGFSDEIKQTLRVRLLVSGDPLRPRIAEYSGRGPLGAWLRAATIQAAINLQRARRPEGPLVEQNIASTAADPELQYLRRKYAGEMREALGAALATADAHDATILRLFFLQGTRAEEIAKAYDVVPRTVRMWIAQAREKILEETRRRLGSRLSLPAGEAESLLRLLRQDLDTSILDLLND